MPDDGLKYGLTLENIRIALQSLSLFRLKTGFTKKRLEKWAIDDRLDINKCPVVQEIESGLDECFSENSLPKCGPLTQRKLFFLLGGYSRFIQAEDYQLSFLFNGRKQASRDAALFKEDLKRWKAVENANGRWTFIDSFAAPPDTDHADFPDAVRGILFSRYIAKMNEAIITKYCSTEAQEHLKELIQDFSSNMMTAEMAVSEDVVPIDPGYVVILAKLLNLLAELAGAAKLRGKMSGYLAEALTWLLIASFLRGEFSADSADFREALDNAYRDADAMGIVDPEISSKNLKLYSRLMKRFRETTAWHPSIRLMHPDPSRFPGRLPAIKNRERTVSAGQEKPISIKDMVMKSWEEHKHLLLVGEGGIGKTVCMLTLPDEKWIKDLQVPAVYVELRDLDIYEGKLNSYLQDRLGNDWKNVSDLAEDTWDGRPRLLLLLDGFNEIAMEYRKTAEKHIRAWIGRPGVQVITTSRISLSVNARFLEYKLEPLSRETIKAFLLRSGLGKANLPDDRDNVWSVINIPLMLIMFIKTDKVMETAADHDASVFLDWKESDNAAHIVWNYLQAELFRLIHTDRPVTSAAAILGISSYVCFEMAHSGKFYVEQKDFQNIIRRAVRFYSRKEELVPGQVEKIRYKYDKFRKEALFEDNACEEYFTILTVQSALFLEKYHFESSGKFEILYTPAHQNFRDALSAVFISGCMLNSIRKKQSFPEEILAAANLSVKNYISEFLTDEELAEIWDYNRISTPESGRVTWILMDIIGRRRNYDYRELDFSGIDLTKTNIHRLLSKRVDICPLPGSSSLLKGTKVSFNSFLSDGHSGVVESVAFSPDSRHLASGSRDRTIRVWNLESGESQILEGHSDWIKSIAYSLDGKHLTSVSEDGTVIVWNLESGQKHILREEKMFGADSAAFSPDRRTLAWGSWEMVEIWDLQEGVRKGILTGHSSKVESIACSPDNRSLASGSMDRTVRIWDSESGKMLHILKGHTEEIKSVSYSPDGRYLASGSQDETVQIWDPGSGTRLCVLEPHAGGIESLAFSPDKRYLACGSEDGIVSIWELESWKNCAVRSYPGGIKSMAYSSDGKQLACGTRNNSIWVWNPEKEEDYVLEGRSGRIGCAGYSPDGKYVVSGSDDRTIRIWDLKRGDCRVLTGHTGPMESIVYCAGGKYLASGSRDKTVRIWNPKTGELIHVLKGHLGEIAGVACSPDGKYLASGSKDRTIRIWDLKTGEEIRVIQSPSELTETDVRHMAGDAGKSSLFTAVWERTYGAAFQIADDYLGEIDSLAYSTDGKLLAFGCITTVHLINSENGNENRVLEGHSGRINSIAFRPDKKHLASGSGDMTVRIWDYETGEVIHVLEGHTGRVECVSYSPDGKYLASGSRDGTIRIWNSETGKGMHLFTGHSGWVESVAYSSDGKHLLSGSADGTIRIWDMDSHQSTSALMIIPYVNLNGANFEKAVFKQTDDRALFKMTGAKVQD